MRMHLASLFFSFGLALHSSSPADILHWPTLHGNPQRHGFYPHFPNPPLKLAWRKELYRELVGPRFEVITGHGLAFVGTYAGNLYAWDVTTGHERWLFRSSAPIGHSPMLHGSLIYFGSMDGKLYALQALTGKIQWAFQADEGIWSSPLVAENIVMFGARDGTFYAIDARHGTSLWEFQTGDRILSSPSLDETGYRVLVASENMHLYCFRVRDGELLWKSRKLHGLSLRDYFPVIFQGLAFITTNPVKDFHATLDHHEELLLKWSGFNGSDRRYIPATREKLQIEQDQIVQFLRTHPYEQTFYAFNITDGKEPWIAPILYTSGLHNPPSPPCVNPQSGEVFVQLRTAYGVWDGGGEVRSFSAIGKLNLETGRVDLIEHGYPSRESHRPAGAKDLPWATFNLIGDETQTLSCSPDHLFSNHQGYLGSVHLKTGSTTNWFGKRDTYGGFYGPGNFGWENEGGFQKAKAAGQPFGIVNEWHGPARAIVSLYGNRLLYAVGSQVLCWEESR